MFSGGNEIQKLELPYYTKFLLIAAYLASHNDAKIDKRLFVKHHGKQRKRVQNIRSNAMVSFLSKTCEKNERMISSFFFY